MNCTGMEKQGNLKFLTLGYSLPQNIASNLGRILWNIRCSQNTENTLSYDRNSIESEF